MFSGEGLLPGQLLSSSAAQHSGRRLSPTWPGNWKHHRLGLQEPEVVGPRIATKHFVQQVRARRAPGALGLVPAGADRQRYEGDGAAGQGFLAITLGFLHHLENTFNDNWTKVLKPDASFQCLCLLTCKMGIITRSTF